MSTCQPRAHYIERDTFGKLLAEYRATGTMPDGLAAALLQLAGGVWDRYRFTADRDDFVQDVVIHLMGSPLQRVDAQKNAFAYLTTCAMRFGMKLRNKEHGDRRRFETYAMELVEAGRALPTTSEHLDTQAHFDDLCDDYRLPVSRGKPVKVPRLG